MLFHSPILAFTLSAALATTAIAAPLFGKAPAFSPGGTGNHVADLNSDGMLDSVSAVPGSHQIQVQLALATGVFAAPAFYQIGNPSSPVTGDLNGDAHVDIVVASVGIGVKVLMGRGDGTFDPPVLVQTFNYPYTTALGDLDADGNLDVVVGNAYTYPFSVLLGNGDGTFGIPVSWSSAPNDATIRIHIADLNADGKLDVVAMNRLGNSIWKFHGAGDGTFTVGANFAAYVPSAMAFGDLNGDPYPDIAYLESEGLPFRVSYRLGSATGYSAELGVLAGTQPSSVTLADGTGDGNVDIVLSRTTGISVFPGVGNGTFLARRDDFSGPWFYLSQVSDQNGDQRSDLLVGATIDTGSMNSLNGIFFIPGNGAGSFGNSSYAVGTQPLGVALADLDGDTHADLVTANRAANTLSILPGMGASGFGPSTDLPMEAPRGVAAGDLNSDTFVDLVVANETTRSLTLLPGLGGGAFGAPVVLVCGERPRFVLVDDVSGDGRDDIVATSAGTLGGNHVWAYVQGDGGVLESCAFYTDREPRGVALADFDADGRIDLVTANRGANNLSIFMGIPDELFGPRIDVPTAAKPVAVAAGDLNGDDIPDLVVACESKFVSVLIASATGSFGSRVDLASIGVPSAVVLGDLDADGLLDVVTGTNPGIEVRFGKGDGTLQPPSYHGFAIAPSAVALGDWSEDGRLDAVVAGSIPNWVYALENTLPVIGAASNSVVSSAGTPFVPEVRTTRVPFELRVSCTVDTDPVLDGTRSTLVVSPNPGRGWTNLTFHIPRGGYTRMEIYDVMGRRVRTLLAGSNPAGAHAIRWDGRDERGRGLASGVYLAKLRSPAGEARTRFVLMP